MSNVEFAYSDTNCRLKVRFKNRVEESFDSMEDLISKVICLEGQYKKLLVLMFYVCLQFAKYCKICCMFLLLLRAVVGCVLYWGCSQRFRQIRGEGTCGRIFFKKQRFQKKVRRGCFFLCGFTGFLRAPALQSASDCFCIVLGPQLSLISRTQGMQGFFFTRCFLLLLFASADIKYFALKSKQKEMCFFFSYRKYLLQVIKFL